MADQKEFTEEQRKLVGRHIGKAAHSADPAEYLTEMAVDLAQTTAAFVSFTAPDEPKFHQMMEVIRAIFDHAEKRGAQSIREGTSKRYRDIVKRK